MDGASFPGWRVEKSITVVTADGMTRVFVKGQPYMSWPSGDEVCLRLAIVQLYRCGLETEEGLAAAFGWLVNSVQRYLADFADKGMQGLVSERSGPKGCWKITVGLRAKILLIFVREGICELEAIQQRLAEGWHETWPLTTLKMAGRVVRWYALRWGIECWPRVLKVVCQVETRQMKSAEALERALALDMIITSRVLLLTRLGKEHPNVPAELFYSPAALEVLAAKKPRRDATQRRRS
jgi:hypothetical protein